MSDADRPDSQDSFDRDAVPSDSAVSQPSPGTPPANTPTGNEGESENGDSGEPLGPGSQIGGYRVIDVLGEGGFGRVYLAEDLACKRQVALKVPRPHRIINPEVVQSLLQEARALIRLEHPHIVQVYAVSEQPPLIAMQYIRGRSLADIIHEATAQRLPWPDFRQAAAWVADIADALACAHEQAHVVHRDVKPGNILIDESRHPYLADFGLTLREEDYGQPRPAGVTRQYMSPEQARREGHRVDGRSDIYSLGAVLYELLTHCRTFTADTTDELIEMIANEEVWPPRQRNHGVPAELSRICRKALANDPEQRYESAADFAQELRDYLESPPSPSTLHQAPPDLVEPALPAPAESSPAWPDSDSDHRPLRLEPKVLQPLNEDDKDFFLDLLPERRDLDRDRLPRTVRFWKTWIERREGALDRHNTAAVGLIFGPSGCGKSSLVRAGILPHLASHVVPICLDATPDDTEATLLHALPRCPGLPSGLALPEFLLALRRGQGLTRGTKLLIVLDQFEQWLYAHPEYAGTDLVRALRQCDGTHVQCLVLVRDEFWSAVTSFGKALSVDFKASNSSAVDLFSRDHAEKILTAFGRGMNLLPDDDQELSPAQRQFLQQAVQELARESPQGKVVCVQLVIFAEVMRDWPWTPPGLRQVGGAKGIGVLFLEAKFAGPKALPEHRLHARAAKAVLKQMLPDAEDEDRSRHAGGEIKRRRSSEELRTASGYANRPVDFDRLLDILVRELPLLTPSDPARAAEDMDGPEKQASDAPEAPAQDRFFQLTHDYLISSIREWLASDLKKRWRGRAQLKLEDCTRQWTAKPERRNLPGPADFLHILLGVRWSRHTVRQRTMMRAAGAWHGALAAVALALLALPGWATWELRERSKSVDVVEALLHTSDATEFERHVDEEVAPFRRWAMERLGAEVASQPDATWSETPRVAKGKRRADAAIALWRLGDPDTACQALRVKEDPELLTQFVHRSKERGIQAAALWNELTKITPEDLTKTKPEDLTVRYGLLLALGEFEFSELPTSEDTNWIGDLAKWYDKDPSSAIHSACGWLLRQWQAGERVAEVDHAPHPYDPIRDPNREWFVEKVDYDDGRPPDYFTFILFGPKPGEPYVEFQMGTPDFMETKEPNEKLHPVRLTRRFAICDREITEGQFSRWPGAEKLKAERGEPKSPDHPAAHGSWFDAVEYLVWLTDRVRRKPCYSVTKNAAAGAAERVLVSFDPQGDGFRLPSEAEWEYPCRGGAITPFGFGSDVALLRKYGNHQPSSLQFVSTACASLRPNLRGLFDMHGNVSEWCEDWYDRAYYEKCPLQNPRGPEVGSYRVFRGGCWCDVASDCRASCRRWDGPGYRDVDKGFRLVRTVSLRQPAR